MAEVERCGAIRRQQPEGQPEGQPARCRNVAGFRTGHLGAGTCFLHLGNSRDHVTHAASLHAERSAAKALEMLRAGPIVPNAQVDPLRALKGMLHESAVLTGHLRQQVQEQLGDAWIGDKVAYGGRDIGVYATSEEVRALVRLYNESIDRTAKLAKTCLDAGVDAAMVELSKAEGQAIHGLMSAALRHLELPPEQVSRANAFIAGKMRELAAVAARN